VPRAPDPGERARTEDDLQQPMEDSAYLMQLLAAFFYTAASVALFRLSSRTGQRPERLLGFVLLYYGLSYFFYQIPYVLGSESLLVPLSFVGRIATAAGVIAVAMFTRLVFRSDAAWAAWLVRACIALIVVGVLVSIGHGDWEGFAPLSNPGFWLEWVGMSAPLAWVGVEGFLSYASSIKRVKFGLCDPAVSNRFCIWGLFGCAQVSSMALMIPMCIGWETQGVIWGWTDTWMGITEMFSVGAVWLAFFPPALYRSWLGKSAVAEAAGGAER
jgi:hypothetical protein